MDKLELTKLLYQRMPGARMPVIDGGYYMWGEVDSTDEWCFCEFIAELIIGLQEQLDGIRRVAVHAEDELKHAIVTKR